MCKKMVYSILMLIVLVSTQASAKLYFELLEKKENISLKEAKKTLKHYAQATTTGDADTLAMSLTKKWFLYENSKDDSTVKTKNVTKLVESFIGDDFSVQSCERVEQTDNISCDLILRDNGHKLELAFYSKGNNNDFMTYFLRPIREQSAKNKVLSKLKNLLSSMYYNITSKASCGLISIGGH